MVAIKRLDASSSVFAAELKQLVSWQAVADTAVETAVDEILRAVRTKGDAALLEYTARFDRFTVRTAAELEVPTARIDKAWRRTDRAQRTALKQAAKRIERYHRQQLRRSAKDWSYRETDGTVLGQKVTPLERVGLYVPGGKAAYPSTVLMTAIPAKVAGVSELVMTVPAPDGELSDIVLAAAAVAGVDRIFMVGGAQAIAALAYGTATIPKVDKIVGPGNAYVAAAKKKVFGDVAIDMVAGPSEILVIADRKANPDWIAIDMLSQAEHDEMAQAILVTDSPAMLDLVEAALKKHLGGLERVTIASRSIEARAALVLAKNLEQAAEIANRIAPEHLELMVENPQSLLAKIRHAGAIFIGQYTSEALGDYVAGPSHVLPTSGTARFSSPLGVYDFQKRSSIIECSAEAADTLGRVASVLARGESLTAHALSAECRIKKP